MTRTFSCLLLGH